MAKKTVAPVTITLGEKVNLYFGQPTEFFNRVKGEGIRNAFMAVVIVIILSTIFRYVGFFSILKAYTWGGGLLSYSLLNAFSITDSLSGSIFVVIIGIIFSFVYSGAMHLFFNLFNGKGTYGDTYKVYSYSILPAILLGVFPIVGFIAGAYSIYLMMIGGRVLHKVTNTQAFFAAILPIALFVSFVIGLLLVFVGSIYSIL